MISRRSPAWGEAEVERLLTDAGIVRHRGKIESTLNNARRARELGAEAGSLAAFFWRYEPPPPRGRARIDHATLLDAHDLRRSRRPSART